MATTKARTITYVWIILSAITIVSWFLGPARVAGPVVASVPITVAVLAMAFIKARLIIGYFMEVRTAPVWLRVATDAWLVVLWGAVLAIYLYRGDMTTPLNEALTIVGVGGMGAAVAHRLGAGRAIVLGDVNHAQLDAVAADLSDAGHSVHTCHVDVTSRTSVSEFARLALSRGRVTRVVHAAGLSPEQASAEAVLAVDLLGVALVLEEFGNVIEPGGAGVVIASMASYFQPPIPPDVEQQLAALPADELLALPACSPAAITSSQQAYPFAKRANQLRVAAAARAWGRRGARINSISPGVISTAMGRQELSGQSGEMMRAMINSSGSGRIGTPDDIAIAAEFLLSDAASFITGIDLLVDGGVVAAVRTGGLTLGTR